MNLSALNSGLSQATNPISTEVNDLGGVLSRPSTSTQSGEDFAAFLRHQIASLTSPQRQEIAAESTPTPTLSSKPKPAAPGLFEQQALRQAFHTGQYLHAKAPGTQGVGTQLNPGRYFAKQLPPAKVVPSPKEAQHAVQRTSDSVDDEAAQRSQHAEQSNPKGPQAQRVKPAQDAQDNSLQAWDTPHAAQAHAKNWDATTGQALQSIELSPDVQIITVAQPATSEKSLTDFALAMGLDPSQVQDLLGTAASTDASTLTPAAATQQILAMNNLTGINPVNPLTGATLSVQNGGLNALTALGTSLTATDGANLPTNAVLAQALPLAPDMAAMAQGGATFDLSASNPLTPTGLQVQWSSASADLVADKQLNNLQNLNTVATTQVASAPETISTLAVLSMMDADLRPEDVDRLKEEFDKLSAADDSSTAPHEGMVNTGVSSNRSNASGNATPAQALKNHPDMAQTFEKLSQKLATELASRMNDQLNAGEWKMKFALKPASLGLVDVQLEMRDGQLNAQFQTDNGLTQNLIQNGSSRLKEALAELGMNNAYVSVGQDNRQSSPGGSGQSGQRPAAQDNRVTLGAKGVGEQDSNTNEPARHSNSALFDTFA